MLSKIELKLSELFNRNPQTSKQLLRRLDLKGISLSHVWKLLEFIIDTLKEREKADFEVLDRLNSTKSVDIEPLLKRIKVLELKVGKLSKKPTKK